MSLQVKIGVTLGFLLILGGVLVADAFQTERSLSARLLGWEGAVPTERRAPFDHLMDVVRQEGFSVLSTPDRGFLSEVLPEDSPRERVILLYDGDRAAFLEWVQLEDAERYFLILKTVLHQTFSEDVEGVDDNEWNTSVRVLTFLDPKLSEEWFIFMRLADQLLEFRVPFSMLDHVRTLLRAVVSSSD